MAPDSPWFQIVIVFVNCYCLTLRTCDATAEIHFSAVRAPWFWVSAYCTRWRIQASFRSSSSRSLNVKVQPRNSILSLDTSSVTFTATKIVLKENWRCTREEILSRLPTSYMAMTMNADQRKWRKVRISAVSVWSVQSLHCHTPRVVFPWGGSPVQRCSHEAGTRVNLTTQNSPAQVPACPRFFHVTAQQGGCERGW